MPKFGAPDHPGHREIETRRLFDVVVMLRLHIQSPKSGAAGGHGRCDGDQAFPRRERWSAAAPGSFQGWSGQSSSLDAEAHEKLWLKIPLKNQEADFLKALLSVFMRSRGNLDRIIKGLGRLSTIEWE